MVTGCIAARTEMMLDLSGGCKAALVKFPSEFEAHVIVDFDYKPLAAVVD